MTISAPRRPGLRPTAASWDSQPSRPRFQQLLFTVAGLALLPAAAATVMRVLPPSDDATARLAAFIPYGLLGYLLALVCLLVALVRARRRLVPAVITVAVMVLTACHLAWLAPLFVDDHRAAATAAVPADEPEHVRRGSRLQRRRGTGGAGRYRDLGRDNACRSDGPGTIRLGPALSVLVGRSEGRLFSNTAIYSRFPLSRSSSIGDTSFQQWVTTVRVPRVGGIRLMAVHPCNPYCGGDRWSAEHRVVRRAVIDNLDHPLVVAGDFNAVNDHGPMQALQRAGLKSATDVAGAGWLPTYPANRPFPPLLPIDHVMINKELTATSVTSFTVSGSDHRGLLATLALPALRWSRQIRSRRRNRHLAFDAAAASPAVGEAGRPS